MDRELELLLIELLKTNKRKLRLEQLKMLLGVLVLIGILTFSYLNKHEQGETAKVADICESNS